MKIILCASPFVLCHQKWHKVNNFAVLVRKVERISGLENAIAMRLKKSNHCTQICHQKVWPLNPFWFLNQILTVYHFLLRHPVNQSSKYNFTVSTTVHSSYVLNRLYYVFFTLEKIIKNWSLWTEIEPNEIFIACNLVDASGVPVTTAFSRHSLCLYHGDVKVMQTSSDIAPQL